MPPRFLDVFCTGGERKWDMSMWTAALVVVMCAGQIIISIFLTMNVESNVVGWCWSSINMVSAFCYVFFNQPFHCENKNYNDQRRPVGYSWPQIRFGNAVFFYLSTVFSILVSGVSLIWTQQITSSKHLLPLITLSCMAIVWLCLFILLCITNTK